MLHMQAHGRCFTCTVCKQEFPARPRSYYEEALRDGRLRVEGEQGLTAATPVHQGQTMRHLIHRHEPPVLDLPIPVRLPSYDFP